MNTINTNRMPINTIIIQSVNASDYQPSGEEIILPPDDSQEQGAPFSMNLGLNAPKSVNNGNALLQNLADNLDGPKATASLGAALMDLSVSFAATQRMKNAQLRNLNTQSIIEQLNNQVESIKSKGNLQFALGIATAAISGLAGGLSLAKTGSSMKSSAKTSQAAHLPQNELDSIDKFNKNAKAHLWAQVINQFHSSVSGGLNSTSSGLSATKDAEVKADDAIIESYRSLSDAQKSLEENLKELIQKALSTQQAIADNINQTRTKILG